MSDNNRRVDEWCTALFKEVSGPRATPMSDHEREVATLALHGGAAVAVALLDIRDSLQALVRLKRMELGLPAIPDEA